MCNPIFCTHFHVTKSYTDFLTSPVYDVAHFHTVLAILTTFVHVRQYKPVNKSLCYRKMENGRYCNSLHWLVTVLHNCIFITVTSSFSERLHCKQFVWNNLSSSTLYHNPLVLFCIFVLQTSHSLQGPLKASLTKSVTSKCTAFYEKITGNVWNS